jgi:hypothetical protein
MSTLPPASTNPNPNLHPDIILEWFLDHPYLVADIRPYLVFPSALELQIISILDLNLPTNLTSTEIHSRTNSPTNTHPHPHTLKTIGTVLKRMVDKGQIVRTHSRQRKAYVYSTRSTC